MCRFKPSFCQFKPHEWQKQVLPAKKTNRDILNVYC